MEVLSKVLHLHIYKTMQTIRKVDMTLNKLVRRAFVQGMTHFSVGEEAASAASVAALREDDLIFSNHRGHGQTIAKGIDLNQMMAELAGKATGSSKGKGGSMHLANLERGNYGTNGIVGGGYALAVGAALTQQYTGSDKVVVAYSGDSATNEGSFHESLNLASIWKLPVIFFIINNRYGISTPISYSTNIDHLYKRADAYGIRGIYVADGNDVVAVYEAMQEAVEHARSGKGPVLVEVESYRWFGHSTADAGAYRTKEEVDGWKAKDPLKKHKAYLLENALATEDELTHIEQEVDAEVKAAVDFAKASPDPDLSVAFEDVFVD